MLTSNQKNYLKKAFSLMDSKGIADAISRTEQVVTCLYDFSVDGGGVSTITPDTTFTFPEAMIVTKIVAHEISALTSGGSATVQLKAGTTSLTDALAFDTGFTGADELALASSATAIAVAANDVLKVTVGTAALTAGKVRFHVYAIPQRDM